MASVLIPVAYLAIVLGSLLLFSHFYRKQSASHSIDPYFPTHPERNTYITLLGKTDPPASEALLKAALVRRAMADVLRVTRLREDKQALQNLLQKGSVGDDLWTSFLAAEKEIEAEILEVMREANSFVEGWGQLIFGTAQEMIMNERMRAIFDKTADVKVNLETRYGVKAKHGTEKGPTLQLTAGPPPPQRQMPASESPVATSPPAPSLPPPSATSTNGLAPPSSAISDTASDSESVTSPKSATSTASRKSGKKGKKRK